MPYVWLVTRRQLWILVAAASVLWLAGCAASQPEGTCTLNPTPGVTLDTSQWGRAHPGGRVVVCAVGTCGDPTAALGQRIHRAGPVPFVAREYGRTGRLIGSSRLNVVFRWRPRTSNCGGTGAWSGGLVFVDRKGTLRQVRLNG